MTTTREALVIARDAAWARYKASERSGHDVTAFADYVAANHALHKFDMPHLAALTPLPDPTEGAVTLRREKVAWLTDSPEPTQEKPQDAE